MSTGTKQSLASAREHAEQFRGLFIDECFERWEVAGSVRRGKSEVGDIEHVVIQKGTNVWKRLDGLLPGEGLYTSVGIISKAVYGHTRGSSMPDLGPMDDEERAFHGPDVAAMIDEAEQWPPIPAGLPIHRWGPKYRGVMFRGIRHEIFTADGLNFGAILAIRSGPAEFSQHLVTLLKNGGQHRQQDGYVKDTHGNIVPVPDEQTFFQLCGHRWLEPHERDNHAGARAGTDPRENNKKGLSL